MASLTDKLKGLYARAILRPEEESDTGRMNEARNAAFLLLKIARENGVQLKFIVNPEEKRAQAREATAEANPQVTKTGPTRYERPKPASAPVYKRNQPGARYDYDYDAAGWKTCPCGKPIATRTWFSPFNGCTHVEQDGSPVT